MNNEILCNIEFFKNKIQNNFFSLSEIEIMNDFINIWVQKKPIKKQPNNLNLLFLGFYTNNLLEQYQNKINNK